MPDWDRLYELAAPQAGYFSRGQGIEAGYSPELIQYYMREGRVLRAGRGLFRLTHFPAGDYEDLVVDWLWSGKRGIFSHETALAMRGLSDALPAKHHLTVPASWRRRRLRVPANLILSYRDIMPQDITWTGAIPLTSPLRTVVDCITDHVEPDLVERATAQATRRGLFSRADLKRALAEAAEPARRAGA